MQTIAADLSKLTTRQSLSRYNLDSRLDNVINTGGGLESIYGQRLIKSLGLQNVRAMHVASVGMGGGEGNIFIIAADEIWSISRANGGSFTMPISRGKVATMSGSVTFAESQGQNIGAEGFAYLYICDGIRLYRVDMLSKLSEREDITNAMPIVNGTENTKGIPSFISMRGHRLLLTCSNSTQFFYSRLDPDSIPIEDINNPSEDIPDEDRMFPALNFYSTETKADKTLRVIGLDLIYAFGSKTVEVWRDNNDAYDPYTTSINGAYLEGMAFPDAVAIIGNEIYYFDNHFRLCRMSGGRSEVLSDRSSERIWDNKRFGNAFAIYTNGCFIACFQTYDGFTIGYNTKSGSISEMSCLSKVRASQEEYLCHKDGNLCVFDDRTYTMADGEIISKTIQLEVIHSLRRFSLEEIIIDYSIQTIPDIAAINNQVFLFISQDGLIEGDARVLSLELHSNALRAHRFGLCGKMRARIVFTNSNPVVFNSVTFLIEETAK
jgi:hypothetical protein